MISSVRRAMNGPSDERTEWRTSPGAKVAMYALVVPLVGLGGAAAAAAAAEGDVAVALWFCLMIVAGAATATTYAHRSRVTCTPNELVIVNLLRERRLNWGAIATAESGYWGVVIRLKNGRRVTATAVQKSNLSELLGRRTRSDDPRRRHQCTSVAAALTPAGCPVDRWAQRGAGRLGRWRGRRVNVPNRSFRHATREACRRCSSRAAR